MAITLTSAALIASATPLSLAGPVPDWVHTPSALASEVQAGQEPSKAREGSDTSSAQVAQTDPPADNAAKPSEDEIIVSGASDARKKDPLVEVNETAFAVTQKVDAAVVEPIADVYEEDLPSPIRKGLRNFFRNLLEPITALNYFLQLKPGKGFETIGRFALNSTVGVAGLFDVAKKEPFNLPYRRNGFGNTLGYYGVEPGPFLVLPLIGATTLRDLVGSTIDQSIVPFAVGKPFNTPLYAVPAYTVNALEFRINFDDQIEAVNASDDPYFAMREIYLCQREADIAELKNRPAPRDCSIEAILGLNEATVATLSGVADPAPALDNSTSSEVTYPQDLPSIIYVSNPVIQPLPADYVQAPPPST